MKELTKMEWNLIYFSSVKVYRSKQEKELDIFCYYIHNHFLRGQPVLHC